MTITVLAPAVDCTHFALHRFEVGDFHFWKCATCKRNYELKLMGYDFPARKTCQHPACFKMDSALGTRWLCNGCECLFTIEPFEIKVTFDREATTTNEAI